MADDLNDGGADDRPRSTYVAEADLFWRWRLTSMMTTTSIAMLSSMSYDGGSKSDD